MKSCLLFLFLFTLHLASADLRSPDMSITLSSDSHVYQRNEVIQLNVTFTNLTNHVSSVLLPYTKNKGKRMLFLTYYSVDENDFYTPVHIESRELYMDTSFLGQTYWKYLDAKESVTFPLFLNDSVNYKTKNAAHHSLPNLPAGRYEVLVWYAPWDDDYAESAYGRINLFGGSDDSFSTQKIYLDEQTQSNYFSLTISDTLVAHNWQPTSFCPANCSLCKSIDEDNWSRAESILDKQTFVRNKNSSPDSSWLQPHRNIAWVSFSPDAILASLPTFTYRTIIFKNTSGYYYYAMKWQLGTIRKLPSRTRQIIYWLTRLQPPIHSDNLEYQKLIKFERF